MPYIIRIYSPRDSLLPQITLPPVLSQSGETVLNAVRFDGIESRIGFVTEDARRVNLRLPCRCLWSGVDPRGGSFNIGQVRLADPAAWLDIWQGRYVAAPDPTRQMRAARNGFQIMIGMRAADAPLALHFIGARTILLLPITTGAVPVWQIED